MGFPFKYLSVSHRFTLHPGLYLAFRHSIKAAGEIVFFWSILSFFSAHFFPPTPQKPLTAQGPFMATCIALLGVHILNFEALSSAF